MNVCPICLFVNPSSSTACLRCGKHQFDDRPAGVSTMTADAPASDPLPLSDPCAATTTDAVSPSGPVTKRSSRFLMAEALRVVSEPPPTVFVPCESSEPAHSGTRSSGTRLGVRVGLEVVRGEKPGKFLPILEGRNVVGRAVTEPVDIDLGGQEPVERVWVSRKHAVIHYDGTEMILEDLNSLNGTFVNRARLAAGSHRAIQTGDVVQFGTVQVRVTELPPPANGAAPTWK